MENPSDPDALHQIVSSLCSRQASDSSEEADCTEAEPWSSLLSRAEPLLLPCSLRSLNRQNPRPCVVYSETLTCCMRNSPPPPQLSVGLAVNGRPRCLERQLVLLCRLYSQEDNGWVHPGRQRDLTGLPLMPQQ